MYFKLDYTIETPQERSAYIENLINNLTEEEKQYLSPSVLDHFGDYIIFAIDKEERKNKKILTDNRLTTINKRETSYEGLLTKFENGEDGIYNLIADNKNIFLTPKISITPEDIETVPGLKELQAAIAHEEELFKAATGRRKYLLKKSIIEMRQEQYVLKNSARPAIQSNCMKMVKTFTSLDLSENITFNDKGEPVSDGIINLFDPVHVSAILCNYSALKEEVYGNFSSDAYYFMCDFDDVTERALAAYPLLYALMVYKIDGRQNKEIQDLLLQEFGVSHSVEYISSLWRNKIPKLIAEKAREEYLLWYYTYKEYGEWKRCSRCGQIKLKHNRFFSKNSTSKDNYYSICKECRNKKEKEKK